MEFPRTSQQNIIVHHPVSDQSDENSEAPTPKRRREVYEDLTTFENEQELQHWLTRQSTWTKFGGQSNNAISHAKYFYCRHARREAEAKCPAKLKVETSKQTGKIQVKQAQDHNHGKGTEISPETKQFICAKVKQKMTPTQIRDALLDAKGTSPKLKQIQNHIAYEKRTHGQNKMMTEYELREHCVQQSAQPDDPNKAFIISHDVNGPNDVFIMWTTPHLLQAQRNWAANFCVDATYKILTLNWPVLRGGFVDANGRFHATAIAVSTHEDTHSYMRFFQVIRGPNEYTPKFLMADSAASITRAAQIIWPSAERATCYFHMMKAQKDRFKPKNMCEYWDKVKADISSLSMAGSFEEFLKAAEALERHWDGRWPQHVQDVLTTFYNVYVRNNDNCVWYNGEWPRTNNSLESTNRQFKDRATLHQRLPIREFLNEAAKHMRVWSLSPEHQQPATRPKIDEISFKAAYELQKEGRPWVEIPGEVVLIPSAAGMAEFGTVETAANMAELYNRLSTMGPNDAFESWMQYKELRAKFHFLRPSTVWPDYFYCSCYYGVKNKACKHNVFILCAKDILEYPASVTSEQLQACRKRGRPKKVLPGGALQRD